MTESSGDPGSEGDRTQQRGPGRKRLIRIANSASGAAGNAYQGAMESVFAIVIATGIGYWADDRFGTEPRWLIVGAIVGFAAFVLRLARMAKLIQEPEKPESGPAGTGPEAQDHRNNESTSDSSTTEPPKPPTS